MPTLTPVPEIQIKKIDKILKRDAEEQRLTAGTLLDVDEVRRFSPDGTPLPPTPSVCKSAGRCAIGALLLAANFPIEKFVTGETINELTLGSQAAKLLKKEYGLLPVHTGAIERVNDDADDCGLNQGQQLSRYEEVMGVVSFIAVMQDNGIRFSGISALTESYIEGFYDIVLPD
jgi:hypothetical protein